MSTISARELKRLLDGEAEITLVDVLPEEYFSAEHLPTAKNACVYKMDFLDAMAKLAPNRGHHVVVYGSSSKNMASAAAASKLTAAGWSRVSDFKGGINEWRNAGYPAKGTGSKPDLPQPQDRAYHANTEESIIEWTGRNIGGKHTGTLKLSSGEVTIEGGKVARGQFIIDMKSISDSDIADRTMASMLVHHLISDDFFDVEKYPEGRLSLVRMEPIENVSPGRPNYTVHGKLTLKAIERDIDFPALVAMRKDGSIIAQAGFEIDRTEWNITYGSGRFFEDLGMHLVNDLVGVQLKVVVE